MSRSIISNEKRCIVCGDTRGLHKHHIFYGTANRQTSEKFGAWCYLCPRHHNMSNYGVHADTALDKRLKTMTQEVFEKELGWSREKFMEIFGRNYL